MLRISTSSETESTVTLSLEGKLDEAGVALLVQKCRELTVSGRTVELDLRCLRFADASGVRALNELPAATIRLVGTSPLVQGLLSRARARASQGC